MMEKQQKNECNSCVELKTKITDSKKKILWMNISISWDFHNLEKTYLIFLYFKF